MQDYANGIYFGMPFEEYEKIERLSKSGIKRLRISPADFWQESYLNPNPPKLTPEQQKRKQKAKLMGSAYHCARLEPDEFDERYVREISQADFADQDGFLGTGAAIEAELARRELPKKSKDDEDGVLSQARRLAAAGYEGPIWHILEAEYRIEKGDRIGLPAEDFDQIVIDMERIRRVPEAHDALSNGCAEVSILYTCPDTGLPMKARLDWLRGDGWVEFKSFANTNGKPVDQCLLDAIRFNRYYIDLAAYHEAVEQVRSGAVTIAGDYAGPQATIVDQIKAHLGPLPNRIIFQQKGGVPNVLSREVLLFERTPEKLAGAEYDREITTPPTMLMMRARAEIKRAKQTFIGYSEIYPRGEPWLPFDPHATIGDIDFHPNWLEER